MRAAIVVGNGAYTGSAELDNPTRDAIKVTRALRGLGFRVFSGLNLDHDALVEKFEKFSNHLEESEQTDVGLIYFSGHGLQKDGINFLVPIGAEAGGSDRRKKLVSLQEYVDRITPDTKRRLVILDACRSAPTEDKLASGLESTKGYYIDDELVSATGLAEISADTNTFFAFAAGPGEFAYDGRGDLSPFTQALVKNIDAVDLPLTNLTTRIRNDVLAATDEKQRTWDTSSLTEPFFFNPGSLLLLIGNAIGVVALVMAFLPYTVLLHQKAGLFWCSLGGALLVFVLILLMSGLNGAYARLRGDHTPGGPDDGGEGNWNGSVIRKGATGGVFGGVIAAFLVAVPYQLFAVRGECNLGSQTCSELPEFGQLLMEITLAGVLVAVLLGICSLALVKVFPESDWFERYVGQHLNHGWDIVAAAVLGGIVTGVVGGPLLTMYFGQFDRPFLAPEIFAPGATLGTAVIAFAIVNYSLEKFSISRLGYSALGVLKALLISGILGALAIGFLYMVNIIDLVYDFAGAVYWNNVLETWSNPGTNYLKAYSALAYAGAIYGLVVGPFLGLLIGLSLRWNPDH